MLVAFFKPKDDAGAVCEIVKYVDRIWVREEGDLTCVRTFILHVLPDSPQPLTAIRMLVPYRTLKEVEDISATCLDEGYLFNGGNFSTGGYELLNLGADGKHGRVHYDFFEATVHADNQILIFPGARKQATVIAIGFDGHNVQPGEFRLVRIKHRTIDVLEKIFPFVFSMTLSYLSRSRHKDDFELFGVSSREIPIRTLFNRETRQGGFDTFLHLPYTMEGRKFKPFTETISKHLPDGSIGDKNMEKFIWRARACVADGVDYLRAGKNVFTIEGVLSDAYQSARMQTKIEALEQETIHINGKVDGLSNHVATLSADVQSLSATAQTTLAATNNLSRSSWIGLVIGIIALAIGVGSLLLTLFPAMPR